jgi:hypothetical protein
MVWLVADRFSNIFGRAGDFLVGRPQDLVDYFLDVGLAGFREFWGIAGVLFHGLRTLASLWPPSSLSALRAARCSALGPYPGAVEVPLRDPALADSPLERVVPHQRQNAGFGSRV